jgi:hypothetical protein
MIGRVGSDLVAALLPSLLHVCERGMRGVAARNVSHEPGGHHYESSEADPEGHRPDDHGKWDARNRGPQTSPFIRGLP